MTNTPIHAFIKVVRGEGLRGLATRTNEKFRKYFRFTSNWLISYDINPDEPLPAPKTRVRVAVLDPLDMPSLEAVARMYRIPATVEGLLSRLALKEYCYVAWLGDRPVSYCWFSYDEEVREYGELLFRLKPDEVYVHDAYTIPELRGQGIYPFIKAIAARDVARLHNARKMLGYAKVHNYASINASRKLGEWKVGWFGYLRLFGRKFPLEVRFKPRKL